MYSLTNFQLQISSPNHLHLNIFHTYLSYILSNNQILSLNINRISVPTNIKNFTVLNSPHIFKTARTQLELRNMNTTLVISNFITENQIQVFNNVLDHLINNLPTSLNVNINHYKQMFL